MGISLHVTSITEGTVSRSLQYLHGEGVTGTLSVSFGRQIPDALIFVKVGAVVAAEFGDLRSAVESIAYRRGPECGDECRKILYQIIVDAGGDKGRWFGTSTCWARTET